MCEMSTEEDEETIQWLCSVLDVYVFYVLGVPQKKMKELYTVQ